MNPIPTGNINAGRMFTAATQPPAAIGVNSANAMMFFRGLAVSRPPEERLLYGNLTEGYSLIAPLKVRLELEDDGSCIVSDDLFAVYGQGPTSETAIADYVTSLIEYFDLMEISAKDHEPTASLFRRLGSYVTRVSRQSTD
jgi:hypothetical protein